MTSTSGSPTGCVSSPAAAPVDADVWPVTDASTSRGAAGGVTPCAGAVVAVALVGATVAGLAVDTSRRLEVG